MTAAEPGEPQEANAPIVEHLRPGKILRDSFGDEDHLKAYTDIDKANERIWELERSVLIFFQDHLQSLPQALSHLTPQGRCSDFQEHRNH